ncbi:DUF2768 domain-containing protein [Salinicoccus sp. CNSTN-B1]
MFDISRMDLMWISFYSIGAMALAAVLIYVARYKMNQGIFSFIVSMIAWALLIIAFLLMIPVLGVVPMHRWRLMMMIIISTVFMAGCLYPESEKAERQMPDETQIQMVQNAVELFSQDSGGLLPIKTKESQREYLEYQIDFEKLVPDYLEKRPENSYEMGGHYQYVVIDAEDDPKVKLADLRITEEVRSLRLRLNAMGIMLNWMNRLVRMYTHLI